jgi:hypothetical protein
VGGKIGKEEDKNRTGQEGRAVSQAMQTASMSPPGRKRKGAPSYTHVSRIAPTDYMACFRLATYFCLWHLPAIVIHTFLPGATSPQATSPVKLQGIAVPHATPEWPAPIQCTPQSV